jgi:predicted permease
MGILVPLLSYPLASLALKPAGVETGQRQAFRFSAVTANTAFLGFPICQALFGSLGLVYAVLYDFGTTLIVFTFGVWALNGGRLEQWRPLIFNPLILGVLAGLAWAFSGWSFPGWLSPPFQALGGATLPLALLVGGAQIGNLNAAGRMWRQQLTGLSLVRLVVAPLLVGLALVALKWDGLLAGVIFIQAAMPAGLMVSMMAETYGADARFAAAATLWTTIAAVVTLPLAALLVLGLFL